ncbi:MAG: tape measure protein [candidate division WOR-3 bacterium]
MKIFIDLIVRGIEKVGSTISQIPNKISNTFKNITEGFFEFIKTPIGAITGALAGAELFKRIDEFKELEKQLIGIEGSSEVASRKLEELSNTAFETGQSISSVVNVYQMFRGVFSEDIATTFTNQLVRIADGLGLSEEQVQSLSRAFVRLFTDAEIGSREFIMILNQSPAVLGKLASEFSMSASQFRQMVEEGKISAREIAQAFLKIKPPEAPKTFSEQLNIILNKLMLIIFKLGEKLKIWQTISYVLDLIDKAIDFISNLIENIKNSLAKKTNLLNNIYSIFQSISKIIEFILNLLLPILSIISKIASVVGNVLLKAFEIIFSIVSKIYGFVANLIDKIESFINKDKKVKLEVEQKVEEKPIEISKALEEIPQTTKLNLKSPQVSKEKDKELTFAEILQIAQKIAEIEKATNEELLKRIGINEKLQLTENEIRKIKEDLINKELSILENVKNREQAEFLIYNYSQAIKQIKTDEKRTLEEIFQLAQEYTKILEDSTIPEDLRIEKLNQLKEQINNLSDEEKMKWLEYIEFIAQNQPKAQIEVEPTLEQRILSNLQSSLVSQAFSIGQSLGQALISGSSQNIRQLGMMIFNTIVQSVASAVAVSNPILGGLLLLAGGILSAIFSGAGASQNIQASVQNNVNIVINIGEAIINDKEYWERLAGRIIFPSLSRGIGQERGGSG